jgi:hypothetical protein
MFMHPPAGPHIMPAGGVGMGAPPSPMVRPMGPTGQPPHAMMNHALGRQAMLAQALRRPPNVSPVMPPRGLPQVR